jgi:GDP-mannose 6-dehydrogenase
VRTTLLPGILEEPWAPALARAAGRTLGEGLGICNNPEFLREGSAIKDYSDPPFVVVGASAEGDAAAVLELYESIQAETIVVDTRTAALLKYACNAFHALKVSFANEIGTLAMSLGADGHKVMRLLCMDDKLNISKAYLRPGLAFGGSCLPKDLRALARFAQQQAIDVDLLPAILSSNQKHLNRAIKAVQDAGSRRVGLVGLGFKAGTDDLRESSLVLMAETLIGKGFKLKVYDPNISMSRLHGRNLAYVDQHLPHLAELLVDDREELYAHAELLVLGSDVLLCDWRAEYQGHILDLRSDLVGGQAKTCTANPSSAKDETSAFAH